MCLPWRLVHSNIHISTNNFFHCFSTIEKIFFHVLPLWLACMTVWVQLMKVYLLSPVRSSLGIVTIDHLLVVLCFFAKLCFSGSSWLIGVWDDFFPIPLSTCPINGPVYYDVMQFSVNIVYDGTLSNPFWFCLFIQLHGTRVNV